jgi:hypothetical protein
MLERFLGVPTALRRCAVLLLAVALALLERHVHPGQSGLRVLLLTPPLAAAADTAVFGIWCWGIIGAKIREGATPEAASAELGRAMDRIRQAQK